MRSDAELLRDYVRSGSQAAFTELVHRHLNVVYRAALRRMNQDAHAAEDVTQRVFTALARKAPALQGHTSLTGWLYTSTRFVAAGYIRSEQRRRRREEEADAMNSRETPGLPAGRLEPFLDEILDRLPGKDREALLLHFFEDRTFADIAQMLSTSADAVRMRVNRALEKLRSELAKQGVASTGAALAAALAHQAVAATSAPLAPMVAKLALTQAGGATGWLALAAGSKKGLCFGGAAVAAGTVLTLAVSAVFTDWPGSQNRVENPSTISTTAARAEPAHEASAEVAEEVAAAPVRVSAPTHLVAPAAAPLAFNTLAQEEKNLLAFLWRGLDRTQPGKRTAFRVGHAAPNFAGIQPLLDRGWVAEGRSTLNARTIYLTAEGIAFCSTQREAIAAHAATANLRAAPR